MRAEGRGWSQPLKYVGRERSEDAGGAAPAAPEERDAILSEALML